MSDVYEYFTIEINNKQYIKGYKIWNSINRPDLVNNPIPIMNTWEIDWNKDEYGNLKYILEDNQIKLFPQSTSEHEVNLSNFRKIPLIKIIKALINGIDTAGNGAGYKTLKGIMDKIQNNLL